MGKVIIMEKNISIDILKFIAVLFITNSHMNYVYGEYGALATGGQLVTCYSSLFRDSLCLWEEQEGLIRGIK